jgi:hypothetical protein
MLLDAAVSDDAVHLVRRPVVVEAVERPYNEAGGTDGVRVQMMGAATPHAEHVVHLELLRRVEAEHVPAQYAADPCAPRESLAAGVEEVRQIHRATEVEILQDSVELGIVQVGSCGQQSPHGVEPDDARADVD